MVVLPSQRERERDPEALAFIEEERDTGSRAPPPTLPNTTQAADSILGVANVNRSLRSRGSRSHRN